MEQIARDTRVMLEGSKIALIAAIDNNLSKPNPHHMNKDLMTTLLRLEMEDEN